MRTKGPDSPRRLRPRPARPTGGPGLGPGRRHFRPGPRPAGLTRARAQPRSGSWLAGRADSGPGGPGAAAAPAQSARADRRRLRPPRLRLPRLRLLRLPACCGPGAPGAGSATAGSGNAAERAAASPFQGPPVSAPSQPPPSPPRRTRKRPRLPRRRPPGRAACGAGTAVRAAIGPGGPGGRRPGRGHRSASFPIGPDGPYVTPLVRKLAAEHGVDLAQVSGTGVGGRIRKQDVLDAARAHRDAGTAQAQQAPTAAPAAPGAPAAQPVRGRGGRGQAGCRALPRCAAPPSTCHGFARSSPSGWWSRCRLRRSSPPWSRPT